MGKERESLRLKQRREAAEAKERARQRRKLLGWGLAGGVTLTLGSVLVYVAGQGQARLDLPQGSTPEKGTREYLDYLIEKYKDDGFPPTDEELSGLALSTAVSLCSQVSCNLTPQSLSEKTIFSRDTLKFYDALKKTGTRTVGNPLGFTDNKEGVSYINLTSGQRVWEDLRQNDVPPIKMLILTTSHEQIHLNAQAVPFLGYRNITLEHTTPEGWQVISTGTTGFRVNTTFRDRGEEVTISSLENLDEGYVEWANKTLLGQSGLPYIEQVVIRSEGEAFLYQQQTSARTFGSVAERLGLTPQNTWGFYKTSNLVGFTSFLGEQAGLQGKEAEVYGFLLTGAIDQLNQDLVFKLLENPESLELRPS